MKTTRFTYVFFATLAASALSAQGALLVYEGFDYTAVGDELIGKGGTTEVGFNGASTWQDAAESGGAGNDMYLKSGSLNFSDLNTSGNHIGFESNLNSDIYNRSLSAGATSDIAGIGSSNGTIYFSFMFEKLQNNFGADHEGMALMNGILPDARWDSGNGGAIGRHGFGIAAVDGTNLQAVAYDGVTGARIVSSASVPITTVNGSSNTSTSNVEVNFIVGQISFNTGTGGADEFSLWYANDDGSLDSSDLVFVETIEADVDEALLDTLNLTRQVNVNWDEVRYATTLDEALGVPEPSTTLLGGLGALLLLRRRRS